MIENIICFLEKKRKDKEIYDQFLIEFFKKKSLPFKLDEIDRKFYSVSMNPTKEEITNVFNQYQRAIQRI